MIVIKIAQDHGIVDTVAVFKFKEEYFDEAMKFVETCLETGEPNTKVLIEKEDE